MPTVSPPSLVFPEHRVDQDRMIAVIERRYRGHPDLDRALALMRAVGVRTRYLARPLYEVLDHATFGQRNRRYARDVVDYGTRAADAALRGANLDAADVDLLVFVSCTGYMLPGPDAYIANELGCRPTMRRTPIQQLGCAAGVSALAEAYHFVQARPGAKALVVAVELCSLSYQPEKQSLSDFISSALFSDGAAAAVVRDHGGATGFEIVGSLQHLLDDSTDVIYGETSEIGFHFWTNPSVRRAVPRVVPTLRAFIAAHGWEPCELDFCVSHTGGPQIMDGVEGGLGLPPGMLDPSRASLADVGNCSSVSVFGVLRRHHLRPPADGAHGVMVAFGPGFTTEALAGTWVAAPATNGRRFVREIPLPASLDPVD